MPKIMRTDGAQALVAQRIAVDVMQSRFPNGVVQRKNNGIADVGERPHLGLSDYDAWRASFLRGAASRNHHGQDYC